MQDEQSKRFKEAAEKLIKDGDLNPIEANESLNRIVTKALKLLEPSSDEDA